MSSTRSDLRWGPSHEYIPPPGEGRGWLKVGAQTLIVLLLAALLPALIRDLLLLAGLAFLAHALLTRFTRAKRSPAPISERLTVDAAPGGCGAGAHAPPRWRCVPRVHARRRVGHRRPRARRHGPRTAPLREDQRCRDPLAARRARRRALDLDQARRDARHLALPRRARTGLAVRPRRREHRPARRGAAAVLVADPRRRHVGRGAADGTRDDLDHARRARHPQRAALVRALRRPPRTPPLRRASDGPADLRGAALGATRQPRPRRQSPGGQRQRGRQRRARRDRQNRRAGALLDLLRDRRHARRLQRRRHPPSRRPAQLRRRRTSRARPTPSTSPRPRTSKHSARHSSSACSSRSATPPTNTPRASPPGRPCSSAWTRSRTSPRSTTSPP